MKFDRTHSHFHPRIFILYRTHFQSHGGSWRLASRRKEGKREVKGGRGRRGWGGFTCWVQWWGDETTGFYPRGSFRTNSFSWSTRTKSYFPPPSKKHRKEERKMGRRRRRRVGSESKRKRRKEKDGGSGRRAEGGWRVTWHEARRPVKPVQSFSVCPFTSRLNWLISVYRLICIMCIMQHHDKQQTANLWLICWLLFA